MSGSVVNAVKVTGTTATTSVGTITAPTVGNTLLVIVTIPTANAPITAFTDNLGNTYTSDVTATGLHGTVAGTVYRKTNIGNAPTSLSVTGTTGTFAATFVVVEVAGLDNSSPLVSTIPKTDLSGGVSQLTHTANFTTTNTNDFVLSLVPTSNSRTLNSATNSFVVVPSEAAASPSHAVTLADAGAAGAKSSLFTLSAVASAHIFGAVYKAGKPAVTGVSSPTVAEGATATFTVSLAIATASTIGYTAALANGTADVLVDLSSTLATATLTNGVTFAAGNFSVPSGVSTWNVTLQTVQDVLNEFDETFTLTVDGVVGTCTITDDDPLPTYTVSNAVENGKTATFTVSLNVVSGRNVTFSVSTADVAGSNITAGTDYTALVGVAVVIPAGQLSATVTVNRLP